MSVQLVGFLSLIGCFLLIFLRMPVWAAFMGAGFVGLWAIRGLGSAFNTMAQIPYATASMYVWTVVPLFTLMGMLALYSKLAMEFFDGVRTWIGQFRGGLAMAVIFGLGAFGACTGDPVSAAVTFTALSLPEMRKAKYKDQLSLGSVCAGGIVEALIPPSLGFIIYGALTETSIGAMFIAGIIPGIIIALMYIVIIIIWCRRDPLAGPAGPVQPWGVRMKGTVGMWSLVVVFLAIFGGLYAGVFTPTEAGAAGAFVVLVLALARRTISWEGFKQSLKDTGMVVGMVGFLLLGTLVFNILLVVSQINEAIASFLLTAGHGSPYLTVWFIVIIMWILGCFIDALALSLIMIPILFPVAMHLGFHPVHFGIIYFVANIAGTLTPPFGIIIYAVSGVPIARNVPLTSIFRGAAPFLFAVIALQVLVIYFPWISTWLPSMMKY